MIFQTLDEIAILTRDHKTDDVTFVMGTACEFYRRHLVGMPLIHGCYIGHLKKKHNIQRHHPFKFGFVFTTTCIMIVNENVMKSGSN